MMPKDERSDATRTNEMMVRIRLKNNLFPWWAVRRRREVRRWVREAENAINSRIADWYNSVMFGDGGCVSCDTHGLEVAVPKDASTLFSEICESIRSSDKGV